MQYLYMLREGQEYYKVGISHNVRSRVSVLQTYTPRKIEIVCTKFLDTQAYNAEQELHKVMETMKGDGANEWFKLTPQQAIELAIRINQYPDIDISERVTLAEMQNLLKQNQKFLHKRLDHILNTYQKYKPQIATEPYKKIESIIQQVPEHFKTPEAIKDDTYYGKQALRIILADGGISTSLLQRRLEIGYGRASRIMDKLEQGGYISMLDGIQPRTLIRPLTEQEIEMLKL